MNVNLDISGFKKKELALFCGAGISKNSGLPLANELNRCILEKLPIDKNDIDEIMSSNLPFEAFMETIDENISISKILDIFKDGKPNTNHILIAKLAKKDYLKTIFTTNFDSLIERALEKEGFEKGKHFDVYCNEDQFSKVDFDNSNKISVFKIHGSVDNEESIRITLKEVASKTFSDKRMKVIRHLFSTGNHKEVLILGYSCSDEFDITPQIQSIEKNQKKIIFVDHCKEGEEIEDVRIKEQKNPFKTFPGKRIKCDTDYFNKYIWDSLLRNDVKYEAIRFKVRWETFVDQWAKSLEVGPMYFIPGSVFYKISDFRKAIEYHEKPLQINRATGDKSLELKCFTNLGCAYRGLGDFNKAIDYHKKPLEIAKSTGNKTEEGKCYTNLGFAYQGLGNFSEAIAYHNRSLQIDKAMGNKAGEAICYTNLGIAHRCLGDFKIAIAYHERALQIDKAIGDKSGEAACNANLGSAYFNLGDYKIAIAYHKSSLEIAKSMGNKAGEAICYTNLGNAYYRLGDFHRSIEFHENSLQIVNSTGNKLEESGGYVNLGVNYDALGDFHKAIEYYERSLEIAKSIGGELQKAKCYTNLGVAYRNLGDSNRAIEYYEKSLEIAKTSGDKQEQAICYANLGSAYYDLEALNSAIENSLKAEKIFTEIGQFHFVRQIYRNLVLAYEKIGDQENAQYYRRKLTTDSCIL